MLFRYLCWARSLRSRTWSGDHWPVMNWGRAFGLATSCQRVRGRTVPERAADSWFQEPGLCPAPWGLRSADSTMFPFPRGGGRQRGWTVPPKCHWLQVAPGIPSVPTDRGTLWGRVSGSPWRPHLQQPGRQEEPGNRVWAEPHQPHFLPPPTLPPFHPSSLPSFLPSFFLPPFPPFYPSFFFTFKQST